MIGFFSTRLVSGVLATSLPPVNWDATSPVVEELESTSLGTLGVGLGELGGFKSS